MVSIFSESSPHSKPIGVSSNGIIPGSFFGKSGPIPIGHRQNCFTLERESSIRLRCPMPSFSKLLSHGEGIRMNQHWTSGVNVTSVLRVAASSVAWLILFSLGIMEMSSSEHWSVKIVESGRSGSIEYRDSAGRMSFYWEFGGGDTIAIIWVGDLASWSSTYRWAIDHRQTILEPVAHEVLGTKLRSADRR